MKRLPWLLIVVMFIEIGLDAMGVMGGLSRENAASLPPALFRLALAIIFAVFAFNLRPWALVAWAIMEGLTAFVLAVLAAVFFNKPNLHGVAWVCAGIAGAIAVVTWGFIRCARQWRAVENA